MGGANAVEYVLCEIQKKTHEHGAMRCSYRIEGGSVSPLKDRSDTDGEKKLLAKQISRVALPTDRETAANSSKQDKTIKQEQDERKKCSRTMRNKIATNDKRRVGG